MDTAAINLYSINKPLADTAGLGIRLDGNGAASRDEQFSAALQNIAAAGEDAAGKKGEVNIDKSSKLYEQCEALEVFLLKNLISGMRKTIQKSNLIDTGFAGEMYEDMLYDEYTREFTKNARLGFAELAYLELTGQRGKLINQQF